MAAVALAVALAGAVAAIVWLTRRLVAKTEYAAMVDVEKAGVFYAKQIQLGTIATLRTELGAAQRSLAAIQEKLDDALAELHERASKELVEASPGDVPRLVTGLLERRAARRAVSRAAGHPPEPTRVPSTGGETGADPAEVSRSD